MKTRSFFFKRIFPVQLVLVLIMPLIINLLVQINSVQAVTYTQVSKTGISEFPKSYQTYLNELTKLHPNWTFTAFYTGITWEDFMHNESSLGSNYPHGTNTVIASSESSWLDSCHVVKSGYACASPDIIAYYADPRNSLTESGIFQFLEMSFNSSVHTAEGVKSIIKGSFMENDIVIPGEKTEVSVKAKIKDKYVLAVPNATIKEIAAALKIEKYTAKDKKGNTIENTVKAITGYTFSDTKNSKNYTIAVLGDIDGDGQVKDADKSKVKNHLDKTATLTGTQLIAADTNYDGKVEEADYNIINNYITKSTPITIKVTETKADTTISYADIIMKAAKESGISPYSIAIKIIQEVGRKGSNSVSGTYPGYEGYYNFFNIGAYDSGNAIENGLKYAKEKGWNTQEKSIVDGAKFMSDSYIGVGQNTAYFYKFDVVDGSNGTFWHQYMTNIQDPSSQAKILYNTYVKNNLLDVALNFIIPVYNNMPGDSVMPGTINPKDDTSYFVNGTEVNLRKEPTTDSGRVATLEKNEIVKVLEFKTASANGYDWAHIERSNGTQGYVANKYLTKCNNNAGTEETNNQNNQEEPKNSIAKIYNTYIITIPDKTIKEVMKEVSITSYKVTDADKKAISDDKKVGTTYIVTDEKANKTYTFAVIADTNGDGTINSGDLLALKKYLLGTNTIKDESKKLAMDTNRDNTINSGDLLALKKYLLGTKKIEI